jgi:hypothetical protein
VYPGYIAGGRTRQVVNGLLEKVRILWVKIRLMLPPSLQRALMPRLNEGKEIVRLVIKPLMPVYELRGQGKGGPLTVTYAGLDYAKPFLKDILFSDEPIEKKVGQIPFWHHQDLVEWPSGDIVVVEATKHLVRRLPRQNAIVLPQYVHHVLDVQGDWQDVKGRFRKSVRHELRLTRKFGYEYEVSRDDQDFQLFYRDMYLPTMNSRHGDLASPMSGSESHSLFRQGLLFLVKREGRPVCGSVCQIEEDTVRLMIMGVLKGDQQLMNEGAVGALNALRIEWANQQGYKAVNFLGSGIPRLNGGMFQHKRKWGTAILVPPHLHRQIWIGIRKNTPAVSRLIKDNPFITVDEGGRLHGLIAVDNLGDATEEKRLEWEKRYATPGLNSIIIRSVADLAKGPANQSDDVGLVIPVPLSSGVGNRQ